MHSNHQLAEVTRRYAHTLCTRLQLSALGPRDPVTHAAFAQQADAELTSRGAPQADEPLVLAARLLLQGRHVQTASGKEQVYPLPALFCSVESLPCHANLTPWAVGQLRSDCAACVAAVSCYNVLQGVTRRSIAGAGCAMPHDVCCMHDAPEVACRLRGCAA